MEKNARYYLIAGTIMAVAACTLAGAAVAGDEYQKDAVKRLEEQQNAVSSPGWVIPSTLNPAAEGYAQNRGRILSDVETQQRSTVPQDGVEQLPLKGPKGGGVQTAGTGPEPTRVAMASGHGSGPYVTMDSDGNFTAHGDVYEYRTTNATIRIGDIIHTHFFVAWVQREDNGEYSIRYRDYVVSRSRDDLRNRSVAIAGEGVYLSAAGPVAMTGFMTTKREGYIDGNSNTFMPKLQYEKVTDAYYIQKGIDLEAYRRKGDMFAETSLSAKTGPHSFVTQSRPYDELRRFAESYGEGSDSAAAGRVAVLDTSFGLDAPEVGYGSGAIADDGDGVRARERLAAQGLKDLTAAAESPDEKKDLAETIAALSAKENKTDLDKGILEAAQAVVRDSAYIDDQTREQFEEAIRYVRIAESMKELLEGVDFTGITKALDILVAEQGTLYQNYLSATESSYNEIASLLGIKPETETLPAQYAALANLTTQAKLKILVDLKAKQLLDQNIAKLNAQERQALTIYETNIKPFQKSYKDTLAQAIDRFTYEVKKTLINAEPATTSQKDDQFKALFLLDKKAE